MCSKDTGRPNRIEGKNTLPLVERLSRRRRPTPTQLTSRHGTALLVELMFAAPPILNLTVLRSTDIDRASKFYSEMGLSFTKHRHGRGPEHYASCVNGFVFEIYPI